MEKDCVVIQMNVTSREWQRDLRAIIVDGDERARTSLENALDSIGGIAVLAEAADVRKAIEALKSFEVDVIFLEMNLPDASGLAFAKALQTLKNPPAVVFVSAHGDHALEAFGAHATDYLIKPVQLPRLAEAVDRVRNHVEFRMFEKKMQRIPVQEHGKKVFIRVGDIRFAVARDDYAYIQTETDRYFALSNLSFLEKSLSSLGFLRVHRSFLVNLDQVEEIERRSSGTLELTLNGICDKIPVSRRRAVQLKTALGI